MPEPRFLPDSSCHAVLAAFLSAEDFFSGLPDADFLSDGLAAAGCCCAGLAAGAAFLAVSRLSAGTAVCAAAGTAAGAGLAC